jgi:transposase
MPARGDLLSQLLVDRRLLPQAVEKSLAAEGLLARVVVWKYAGHLPLHRLSGIASVHDG